MNTKKYFACIHFDSHNPSMNKEQQPPATYSVRIPVEMRRKLEESARAGSRSLHAEILLRLGESLNASEGMNSSEPDGLSASESKRIQQIQKEMTAMTREAHETSMTLKKMEKQVLDLQKDIDKLRSLKSTIGE